MGDDTKLKEFLAGLSLDQLKTLISLIPSPHEYTQEDAAIFLSNVYERIEFILEHQDI